jgi:signal transduction histidine kinase
MAMVPADLTPELRERIARRILATAVPATLVAAALGIAAVHISAPERSQTPGLIAAAAGLAAGALARYGRARAGTAVLTCGLLAVIATGMWLNGGVLAPVYLLAAALAVLVAVVHGSAWAAAFVVLVIALGGAFLAASAHGLIGPPPVLRPRLQWAAVSIFTAIAALFAAIPIALLRQVLRELERSSEEQMQFAHISAHDLQEPMRMIVLYLQLMERDAGELLAGRQRQRFDTVIANAQRLQRMVAAILDYTEIGAEGHAAAAVDTNAALGRAIDDLGPQIADSGAAIEARRLPPVLGDQAQFTRLFECLISNALKFRSREPPRVSVSAERALRGWVFSVADNGIGIGPEEHGRLFRLFGRLNHREEFPGEGVGLAICKKIVTERRGRIWIEANPGGGTRVRFSIPDGAPRGSLGSRNAHPLRS